MNKKAYLLTSAVIFAIVAILHLVRALLGVPVTVGETSLPLAVSWGGLIAAAALSIWGFRLSAS